MQKTKTGVVIILGLTVMTACLVLFICGCNDSDSQSTRSYFRIENADDLIQSGSITDSIQMEDSFLELLCYHEKGLFLTNGYAYSKWTFEDGRYVCKKVIQVNELFPQEYGDTNTIDYLKNYESVLACNSGEWISIFDARTPKEFYMWDLEHDELQKVISPSAIRKMQWDEDSPLLYLLTEDSKICSLDAAGKSSDIINIKADISKIDNQRIYLRKDSIIYYDGLGVLQADESPEAQTLVSDVSEFFGEYQNTVVVRRMNNKIEMGYLGDVWKPFYSDKMDYCYPVKGRYLHFYKTENHNEVWLADLINGNLSSCETTGYGYEFFKNTNVIMYFNDEGTPFVQRPGENAELIAQANAEPYTDETEIISILIHDDNGVYLLLVSLKDQHWSKYLISIKEK